MDARLYTSNHNPKNSIENSGFSTIVNQHVLMDNDADDLSCLDFLRKHAYANWSSVLSTIQSIWFPCYFWSTTQFTFSHKRIREKMERDKCQVPWHPSSSSIQPAINTWYGLKPCFYTKGSCTCLCEQKTREGEHARGSEHESLQSSQFKRIMRWTGATWKLENQTSVLWEMITPPVLHQPHRVNDPGQEMTYIKQ